MQPSLQFEGAYSIGTATRSNWWDNHTGKTPFPGQYNIPNFQNKTKAPSPLIGKGQRSNIIDQRGFPEPGKYESKDFVGKDSQYHKISFTKNKNKITHKGNQIAPSQYKPKDTSSKQNLPSFSFGYRFDERVIEKSPGPGVYPREDVEDFKMRKTYDTWRSKSTKQQFNTSSQRWNLRTQQNPGPGEYEYERRNQKRAPSYGFGNAEKMADMNVEQKQLPGPGTFDPKAIQTRSNGFTLAQKLGTSMKAYETDAPGPGAYQPNLLKTNQNIIIGNQKKGDLVEREARDIPAPNVYEQMIPPKQKSYLNSTSIGNSERPPLHSTVDIPGAGTYYPPSKSIEGPQWVMGAKFKEKKKQNSFFPGPGAYEPNQEFTKEAPVEVGMKTSQRSNPVRSKFPNSAPGSYDITQQSKFGSKYSIGNQTRFKQVKNSYEPGPGSYDIGGTIGKIPNYLLLSKRKNQGLLDFQ